MKIAKLPDGNVLQFEDHVPDEEIDNHVRTHMKDHIGKKLTSDQKEKEQQVTHEQRHQELMQGLSVVAQLLHHISTQNVDGHSTLLEALQEHSKLLANKKKTKVLRDDKGKVIGAEEC